MGPTTCSSTSSRSEEHTSELQSPCNLVCRLLLEKKKNKSAHISKETRASLATRPNRFKYVLTPTHGSWLKMVETLFGKMTRTFLFFFKDPATTEIYDLSLLGILPI